MRKMLPLLLVFSLVPTVAVGCGGSSSAADEKELTPAEARAEVGEVRTMLDTALASYRAGDAEAAEQTVGDAYLEHFEHVEKPLGDRDHELMEDLEHAIATDIRGAMKDKKPAAEVAALIAETKANLAKADRVLAAA